MTQFHKEWPVKGLNIDLPDYSLHWIVEKQYSKSRSMAKIAKFSIDFSVAGGGYFQFIGDRGMFYGSDIFEKYHYIGPVEPNF
jgi:hypothetical protein